MCGSKGKGTSNSRPRIDRCATLFTHHSEGTHASPHLAHVLQKLLALPVRALRSPINSDPTHRTKPAPLRLPRGGSIGSGGNCSQLVFSAYGQCVARLTGLLRVSITCITVV